jgi:uncharacterized protein YkwD
MARTTRWRQFCHAALLLSPLLVLSPRPSLATPIAGAAFCPAVTWPAAAVTQAGHPYLSLAFDALARDRARLAGLAKLTPSSALSAVAEAHSAYMASIGSWSDGDPAGYILSRIRSAGVNAVYGGQNVVTANGESVAQAVQSGEAFFAREAGSGGPHWANITNPNHSFVGMGLALLGAPGNYSIYLTQVFADAGGCDIGAASTSQAAVRSGTPRVGSTVRAGTDYLSLRSEPGGTLIQTLRASQRLKVVAVQQDWAQVEVLANHVYGWVYVPLLG